MIIHIEDWTLPMFINQIEANGLPHGDYLLKAYASHEDPRLFMPSKPNLVIFDSSHLPFTEDEFFSYPRRGNYTGLQLEEDLQQLGLGTLAQETTRALFRFANREDTGLCQTAMDAEKDGCWFIPHPFGDLDGLDLAKRNKAREGLIHLDIFYPKSLERIHKLVDFTDPGLVVQMRESRELRAKMGSIEGTVRKNPEQ